MENIGKTKKSYLHIRNIFDFTRVCSKEMWNCLLNNNNQ